MRHIVFAVESISNTMNLHRANGLAPTLRPGKLSECGQGDEGVGHGVRRVQDTGDVIGLAGLHAADGVRTVQPCGSRGGNGHTCPQRQNNNTDMASDLHPITT